MQVIKIINKIFLVAVLMPSLMIPMKADLKAGISVTQKSPKVVSPFDKPLKLSSFNHSLRDGAFAATTCGLFYGLLGAGVGYTIDSVLGRKSARLSSGAAIGGYIGTICSGFLGLYEAYRSYKETKVTFMQAIKANDAALAKQLIKANSSILLEQDADGRVALVHAARQKNQTLVRQILNNTIAQGNFFSTDKDGKSVYKHVVENRFKTDFDAIICKGNKVKADSYMKAALRLDRKQGTPKTKN